MNIMYYLLHGVLYGIILYLLFKSLNEMLYFYMVPLPWFSCVLPDDTVSGFLSTTSFPLRKM
jgi:hypothetical protein